MQEIWQCNKCGMPCKVEITYSDAKLPEHLKGNERFRRKTCVCGEDRNPQWELLAKGKTT